MHSDLFFFGIGRSDSCLRATQCTKCLYKYKHDILSPNCVVKARIWQIICSIRDERAVFQSPCWLCYWAGCFWACRLPASLCLCCGIFCPTDSSDEKCQTWLPPEPAHLWSWPCRPWRSPRSQFPAFYQVYFGCYGERREGVFCLPTVSTSLPAYNCSSGCLFQSWMSFKDAAVREGGAAWKVHISTSPPCWIKSIGSDIAHPEQTLTCFSTLSQTKTTSCREKEEINTRRKGGEKKNIEICKGFPKDADSFMGLRTPFIYDSLCLVLFVWVLTPSETTLTRQKLDSHTHEQKSYKARDVRGVQEDTQWYKIANWITFFGTQNQSLTFPARTMHKGGGGNQSCLSRWAPNHHYSLSRHDCTPPSQEGFITFFCLSQVIFFSPLWRTWSAGAKEEGKDEKKG